MTTTRYLVYDVFTETAFGGNPLAVIVDAAGVPEENLQRIAREFNFSETTFVYPPEDPAHDAKVRIFTPTMEIPFAGHPTVGTSVALRELGRAGEELTTGAGRRSDLGASVQRSGPLCRPPAAANMGRTPTRNSWVEASGKPATSFAPTVIPRLSPASVCRSRSPSS